MRRCEISCRCIENQEKDQISDLLTGCSGACSHNSGRAGYSPVLCPAQNRNDLAEEAIPRLLARALWVPKIGAYCFYCLFLADRCSLDPWYVYSNFFLRW